MTLLVSACRSIGWPHLVDDIANFAKKPNLTALIPDIKGVDPDDAFSSVPYEKGFSLIYYIEQIVSRHRQSSLENHTPTAAARSVAPPFPCRCVARPL